MITRRRTGLSLVEVMVVSAMTAVVLGIVAGVCNEYANIVRFSSKKDQAVAALQPALDSIRAELGEATTIETPSTPGSLAPQLVMQRIDPNNTARLPATPNPATTSWAPYAASYLLTVTFHVSGTSLLRDVTFPDSSQQTQVLADDIVGFSVSCLSATAWRINVSIQDDKLIRDFSTMEHLRVGE